MQSIISLRGNINLNFTIASARMPSILLLQYRRMGLRKTAFSPITNDNSDAGSAEYSVPWRVSRGARFLGIEACREQPFALAPACTDFGNVKTAEMCDES
jgi:hypothetical protein